ncbi:hypothetical protein [Streptomyces sp. NPDC006640]|uniref:hypothetical protein n=1 Tax=unclassified Streptomyces TaxID=2593676 RepID=UPI00367E3304
MAVPASRRPSRKDARRGRIVLSFFLAIPLLGLITMLSAALFDLVPANAVRKGQGAHGIYRVTEKKCGTHGCVIAGDFTITGASTPLWSGVSIKDDVSGLAVGQNIAAIEVDGSVYRTGDAAWNHDLWVLTLASPALALWGWLVVWRPAVRRRGALWKHLWAPLPLN